MKYTITIQRKTGTNAYDSLMVLASNNFNEYLAACTSLTKMFKRNKSFIRRETLQDEGVLRSFIEYDLSKGETK